MALFRGFLSKGDSEQKIKLMDGTVYTGEWIYWNEFGRLCDQAGELTGGVVSCVDLVKETVCQAVPALKDSNGKNVFDGDVITATYTLDGEEYNDVLSVFYDFSACAFMYVDTQRKTIPESVSDFRDADMHMEVVGTIFDDL